MSWLSLDLSKRSCGWAAWTRDMPKAIHGRFVLGSEYSETGQTYCRLHEELFNLRKLVKFEWIYFEEPINPVQLQGSTNLTTIRMMSGLAAHAESFGYAMGCKVYEVNISTWRKDFLGKTKTSFARKEAKATNRTATNILKRLTIERCKELGFNPQTDDEADALGILDFACSLHDIVPPWRQPQPDLVLSA